MKQYTKVPAHAAVMVMAAFACFAQVDEAGLSVETNSLVVSYGPNAMWWGKPLFCITQMQWKEKDVNLVDFLDCWEFGWDLSISTPPTVYAQSDDNDDYIEIRVEHEETRQEQGGPQQWQTGWVKATLPDRRSRKRNAQVSVVTVFAAICGLRPTPLIKRQGRC